MNDPKKQPEQPENDEHESSPSLAAPRRTLSAAAEDYLKAIFDIQQEGEHASTNRVAQAMNASPAASSKMLKQLATLGLIGHTPYYGARLTPAGERIALEIIRHHRLLEAYLHEVVGYGWDEVDAEAERLEHHISEGFEERIDRILNFPRFDPHGHPIPDRAGAIPPARGRPLTAFQPGDCLLLVRVSDVDPRVLRLLSECGLRLYSPLELVEVRPEGASESGGTVTVRLKADPEGGRESGAERISATDCTLRLPEARHVFVEPCATAESLLL